MDNIVPRSSGNDTKFLNEDLEINVDSNARHGYNKSNKATWLKLSEIMAMIGVKKSIDFRANNGISADEVDALYAFVRKHYFIDKNKKKDNVVIRKAKDLLQ